MVVNVTGINMLNRPKFQKLGCKAEKSEVYSTSQVQMMSAQEAKILRSVVLSNLSFKGYDYSTEDKNSIRIPDLFHTLHSEFTIKADESRGIKYPVEVKKETDLVSQEKKVTVQRIKDGKKELILEVSKKPDCKNVKIGYIDGKAGSTTTVYMADTDKKLYALMIPGSHMKNGDFEAKMPGKYELPSITKPKEISFAGNTYAVLAYKPEESIEAVLNYFNSNKPEQITPGKDAEGNKDKYDNHLLVGGFGTRMGEMLAVGGKNKPSVQLPAQGYQLLDFAINNAISSGALSKDPDITYFIEDDPVVGTAGGPMEGIREGKMEISNSPVIMWPGDGISDIDFSPALKKFEETPDAGIMIVGIPVAAEKILGKLGLIGFDKENNKIIEFIEKPTDMSVAKNASLKEDRINPLKSEYLANIAVYIINPEIMQAIADLEPILHDQKTREYDFGKHVLPALKTLCNGNEKEVKNFLESKNIPKDIMNKVKGLKMYTYVAKGDWCDVGTIPSFMEASREIASGEKYKNLPVNIREGYKENVDLETGVVFMPGTRKEFEDKFSQPGNKAEGNIIVMSKA